LGKNYPVFTFDQILNHQVRIDVRPLPLFQEYLATGYYPFFLEDNYSERLRNVINLTIEVDIPAFTDMNMATSRKLRQLLYIIAQSVPFKPNMTKMGEQIGINRNQVAEYMVYLERAGLINRLLDVNPGIGSLGKVQKIYLNNTNLGSAIAGQNQNIGNARETFFFNQVQTVQPVTASKISDFEVGDMTFEIGGRNKKQTQISLAAKGFVVKDDIEYGIANIIPLWTFGFLY
jgi:predicted AAA+ superfamily ATPase